MKCTLCGCEFDEKKAQGACQKCPMMKRCGLIRCPNCRFEVPQEPEWAKYFKKEKECPMTKLSVNQKGRVARIVTHDDKKLRKIMAMGIIPGAAITLIQKFPAYVFQVGQSQFAIDKELASVIHVRHSS